jgi:tritrans,polycis-undecaprenyl-diphosphate synthase [geranylgeranyl-diphosphate specific]
MKPENVPQHIGIIMDGNRRFSRRLMMKPWKGHEWGSKKVEDVLEWCKEYSIHELTLYTFSIQNFGRPKQEFDYLMKLFSENFRKLRTDQRVFDEKIRINFIGRLHMLPEEIQRYMKEIMELTKEHDRYIINFAIAYGGREEVLDAVKRIAEQVREGKLDVEKINEEMFTNELELKSEPDLIIRTGGEQRTSNFLIWQSNYSEYLFIDKMWPEFDKKDFEAAIKHYANRKRRFGK